MTPESPWYDAAFDEDYLAVYPHRDAAAAREEVRALARRGLSGRVLDLGCGFGRHLAALRELGLAAFGLDRSAALLARVEAPLRERVVRGDFRALPFAPRSFQAVLMLFSSFGYFGDGENAAVLGGIARLLAPGGVAVLDLMNPARIRATLVPRSVTRRGGLEIEERRALVADGTRVVKDVCLRREGGLARSWREDVRLYDSGELRPLLAAAGLTPLRTEGDFDGRPYAPDAPRQILWARA